MNGGAGESVGISWIPFHQISSHCIFMPEFTANI